MYSVLLDLVNKEFDEKRVLELANFLVSKSSKLVVYFSEIPKNVLTKIKRKKQTNLTLMRVEKDATSDAVVKDFVQKNEGNVILIKRAANNVDKFVLEEMMKQHESGNKIVTARNQKDDGFWRSLFSKIRNFVISLLYNFGLFEGHAQLILFDGSLTKSMRQIPNAIVRMTKIDGFRCAPRASVVDKDYFENAKNKSKKRSLKFWISLAVLIVLVAALTLTLIFVPSLKVALFIIPMSLLILSDICVCFAFTSSFVLFQSVGELDDKDIKLKGEII